MKKYFSILIVVFMIFTVAPCKAQEEKLTAVFNQQWLKAIVSIETLDLHGKGIPIGTGFLVSTPNKHIALITAKHVIYENEGKGSLLQNIAYRINRKDGNSIVILDKDESARLKSGWLRSESKDLACRIIIREDISDFVTIPYSIFLPTRQMQAGAPLFVIGFPLGLRSDEYATPIVRRASIARVDQDLLIMDGFVYPGNSGGPVIYEPTVQVGGGFSTRILQGEWLVGMVLSEISYVEPAISTLTKRARVTFEQNTGLSNILPAEIILELLRVPEFVKADEAVR